MQPLIRVGHDREAVDCCYCWEIPSARLTEAYRRAWWHKYQDWILLFVAIGCAVGFYFLRNDFSFLGKIGFYVTFSISVCFTVCLIACLVVRNAPKLYHTFIPQYFNGCRKRMEYHEMSLNEVLLSLHETIPSEENLLHIETRTIAKLAPMSLATQKGIELQDIELKLTGSTAERLSSPIISNKQTKNKSYEHFHALLSDCDFMVTSTSINVSACEGESRYQLSLDGGGENRYQLCLNVEGLELGFAYIYDNERRGFLSSRQTIKGIMEQIQYLRTSDFQEFDLMEETCYQEVRNRFRRNKDAERTALISANVTMQGPAINVRLGSGKLISSDRLYADITFAIKCAYWPTWISDWETRPNRKWPSEEYVRQIVAQGCHLVPKSQRSDRKGLTWRFSFSSAEVHLSKLIPEAARICFLGIKVIVKDYLSIICTRLKSYHLKSIFLYTLQDTDPSIWSAADSDNLEIGFNTLLCSIKQAIKKRHCPHFWIPKINLFEDLTRQESKKLLKRIETIEKSPEKFIEDFVVEDVDGDRAPEEIIYIGNDG